MESLKKDWNNKWKVLRKTGTTASKLDEQESLEKDWGNKNLLNKQHSLKKDWNNIGFEGGN